MDSYIIKKRLEDTKINEKNLNELLILWARWDKDQDYVLALNRIPKILKSLSAPLSLTEEYKTEEMISKLIKNLKIPIYKKWSKEKGSMLVYHFYDLA